MSATSDSLGVAVLYLRTDDSTLRQGLDKAKVQTDAAGKAMRETARIVLSADSAILRADLAKAGQLLASGKAAAAKDLLYQIRTDLGPLKAGLTIAQREARTARDATQAALLVRQGIDLTQFSADLRKMERDATASARRIAEQRRTLDREAVAPRQAAPRAIATSEGNGLGGLLLGGLGLGTGAAAAATGIELIKRAAGGAASSVFGFNGAMEDARSRVTAFTHDARATSAQLAQLDKDAGKPIFGIRALTEAVGNLQPAAKRSGESVQELLRVSEILASLNPNEGAGGGLSGASFALGELSAGDVTSLVERFNIPRKALQDLRASGVGDIQALRQVLAGLGIDFSIVTTRAQNFTTRLNAAQQNATALLAQAGQPLFQGASDLLGGVNTRLSSPGAQQASKALAADVQAGVDQLRRALNDPQVQEGLKQIGLGLRDGATSAGEFAKNIAAIQGAEFVATLKLLGEGSKRLRAFGDAVTEADKKLTGSTAFSRLLLDGARGGLVPTTIALAIEDINKLKALVEREPAISPGWRAILNIKEAAAGEKNGDPYGPLAGRGGPASVPAPAPAPPAIRATEPDTEKQFDITAQKDTQNYRERASYAQGRDLLRQYLAGISSPEELARLQSIEADLDERFKRMFGGLTDAQQLAQGRDSIDGLAAKLASDIATIGTASEETKGQIAAIFGDAVAGDIVKVSAAMGAYTTAQTRAAQAGTELKAAQDGLTETLARTKQATDQAAAAVTGAQDRAAKHQQEIQDGIGDLQRAMGALNKEAAAAARGYADQLQGFQDGLTAFQRAAEDAQRLFQAQIKAAQQDQQVLQRQGDAAQRAFAEQLRVAQGEQQAAQEAATRNAAAAQSVLNGTTDEYLRQNRALSDQERQIIANGNAQVRAALAAKTGADAEVQALEVKQRADLLRLNEQIRAARQPGGAGEAAARALEDQRNLVKARSDYALDLARQRAAVRGDEADAAKKPVEEAAKAQATADKERADAAGQRVTGIQEEARQRAESDRAAQQALQDQIAAIEGQAAARAEMDRAGTQAIQDRSADLQREARTVADDYAARALAIQGTIDQEEERGRTVAAADKQAIADALTRQAGVQAIVGIENTIAQTRVTGAQKAKDLADGELQARRDALTVLQGQNGEFDKYVGKYDDLFAKLRAAGVDPKILNSLYTGTGTPTLPLGAQPSARGGGRDAREDGSASGGAPAPQAPGIFTPPTQKARLPLPTVALPTYQRIGYTAPQPPALNTAALAGVGAGLPSFARQGSAPMTVTLSSTFPNAQFTSDIDVKKAVQEGQEAGLRSFLAALENDSAAGGALSGWRG